MEMKFSSATQLSSIASALPWGRSLRGVWLVLLLALGLPGFNSNPGPRPDLMVVNVTDLGTIPTNPDILGRDGAYSAAFQGYSVWLYGDTFLANPNAEGFTLISDSWSFTSDLNAQDGSPASRSDWIP
jgi:hypothetical protein